MTKITRWHVEIGSTGSEIWENIGIDYVRRAIIGDRTVAQRIVRKLNEPPTQEAAIDHAVHRIVNATDQQIEQLNYLAPAVLAEVERMMGRPLTEAEEHVIECAVDATFFKMAISK
jgi:hypothetical protein